jgi:exopolysaccharide biosynthesis protein
MQFGQRSVVNSRVGTLALLCSFALFAADTESTPFPGVRYVNRHTTEPREIDMHIVSVDMKRPGVRITTTGPNDDPNTQTDFETTRQFVKRTGTHIGINGGFFGYTRKAVVTGKGDLCSLAVSDGKLVCGWGQNQHEAVNIGDDNTVMFVRRAKEDKTGSATNPEIKLYNAIAGNVRLIENGKIMAKGGDPSYPQTAVGHTADHHLILFVSDGRQPGFSKGMTYEEVAGVLKEFGAVDAIAFDGGGSATMVMADGKDGEPNVLNRPSDGKERAVGNNLGVIIAPGNKLK